MHPTSVRCISCTQRCFAKISTGKSLRDKGPVLSLEHFLQRKRAVSLYRDIMRSVKRIPPSSTRSELREFARAEFEQHKEVHDISHIRYLISTGRTQFDSMRRYIEEQAA